MRQQKTEAMSENRIELSKINGDPVVVRRVRTVERFVFVAVRKVSVLEKDIRDYAIKIIVRVDDPGRFGNCLLIAF